jgi:hypothetical protein
MWVLAWTRGMAWHCSAHARRLVPGDQERQVKKVMAPVFPVQTNGLLHSVEAVAPGVEGR